MSARRQPRHTIHFLFLALSLFLFLRFSRLALSQQPSQPSPDKPQSVPLPRPSGMSAGGIHNGSTVAAMKGAAPVSRAMLFHNNHDGTFTDVTDKAGVSNDRWGFGSGAKPRIER